MTNYICITCGTQYAATESEPAHCPICEDERQYVNQDGQSWTTMDVLDRHHKLIFHKIEPNLYGIGMTPEFGIGQRALLVTTPEGNVLWDCIPLINDAAQDIIHALGGIDAIAISHPHFYSSMIDWSHAFGDAPVYLHANDRQWVQRPDDVIHFWNDQSPELPGNLRLYNAGGHFEGGTILHWPDGATGKGALLAGDILQVTADRMHVSFMYSYPNNIPMNEQKITRIIDCLNPLAYDRVYSAWWSTCLKNNAKKAVNFSAKRYINAIH